MRPTVQLLTNGKIKISDKHVCQIDVATVLRETSGSSSRKSELVEALSSLHQELRNLLTSNLCLHTNSRVAFTNCFSMWCVSRALV